jgi:sulfur carrier protein
LLNGAVQTSPAGITVQALLEQRDWATQRVAVAINSAVVPRSRFAALVIQEGDKVEILHAVGGG